MIETFVKSLAPYPNDLK
jgi:hypothetical protein